MFAEFIANDRPLLVDYDGHFYFPVFVDYPETDLRRRFADRSRLPRPVRRQALIDAKGWMIWPPIPLRYDTINYDLPVAGAVAARRAINWLGTDDQGRDVLARLIYGFRISVLFGLTLTVVSSVIGIAAGAVQGYFGGLDRSAVPALHRDLGAACRCCYLLIILASIVAPEFLVAAGLMLLFSLDGAGRRGARRVPARAQFRLCARGARAGRRATASSCSAMSCPTRWWRR